MGTFDVEEVLKELTLEEKAQLCSGRDFWFSQNVERLGIPAIMMCDGPNGLRKQIGEGDHLGINESIETVCYPTESALASSFDEELLRELGTQLGLECQAEHVGMLLGPGVNMKRSPLCGRNFEYLSEDPFLAGKLGAAYVRGLQDQGVAACVKHFAANDQETRRMSGSSEVDERTLREIYLPAFEAVVKEGRTRSVMCAYNAVNGTFCSENKKLLTDILRREWGFEGFVVTDWGAAKNRAKGIMAGNDLEMPGSTTGKTEKIVKAIEDGTLTEAALDAAVRNILIFAREASENQKENFSFDRGLARKEGERFIRESAVLLKNEQVLPIEKTKKAAFIGEFAREVRFQGSGSSHINEKHPISAMQCVDDYEVTFAPGYHSRSEVGDAALVQEAVEAAKNAEVAVIFAGLPDSFETEGCDRSHMQIPDNQNELISEIARVQKNTVVVLHGGSAMELPWINEVKAVLLMHLGGSSVGKATVDLLYGAANPSGKLSETWPLKLEDNPSYINFPGEDGIVNYREGLFIGYRYYDKKKAAVQFPFGHGLSYTSFEYSNLSVEKREADTVTVTFTVKNSGVYAGREAAQIYVGAKESQVIRPVRELKGFVKVSLQPGEEKIVSCVLDRRAFSYYEVKVADWFMERGAYEIAVGASSRDIRLSETIVMESEDEIPLIYTELSVIGDLRKTKRGQAVLAKLMPNKEEAEKHAVDNDNLGEGSGKMAQAMMFEMPLGALVSFGRITQDKLDGLIASLNGAEV